MIDAARRSEIARMGWQKWRDRSRAGNRCNHNPKKPRLELPGGTLATAKGRLKFPWLIQQFLVRCIALYTDRSLFPELRTAAEKRTKTERIEAMVLVARAIGRTTDILTLRSGSRNADGSVTGYTAQTIAKWTGLETQRVFRALWDLRDTGLATLTQPIEQRANGDHRGLAGIRTLTKEFFDRLGLGGRLRRERRELAEKARIARNIETTAQRRQQRRILRQSQRAAALTERTVRQTAEKTAAPAPARVYTVAELAEMLQSTRARREDT